jgi:rieske iron-sulfur protein
MNRRALLQSAFVLGFGIRQDDQVSVRPREGDLLVKADDAAKTPLAPSDIPLGAKHTLAWAMDPADKTVRSGSRLNQLLLVRLAPDALSAETRARAAEGVVAYTAICTHNGCDIDDWLAAEQLLSCSCHSSSFDPKDGGRVVDGPAPRVLPALPLKIVDGKLVVAKPFTSPVGYEKG